MMNVNKHRITAFSRQRASRILLISALVVAGGFTTTLAVQAASNSNRPGGNTPAATEQTSDNQEKTMQDPTTDNANEGYNTSDKGPQTSESVQDDGSGATTTVTVNGETITVPKNGTYERSTVDGNSRTDVRVNNQNQSSSSGDGASNSSSSTSKVEINSHSSSSSQ